MSFAKNENIYLNLYREYYLKVKDYEFIVQPYDDLYYPSPKIYVNNFNDYTIGLPVIVPVSVESPPSKVMNFTISVKEEIEMTNPANLSQFLIIGPRIVPVNSLSYTINFTI